VADGSHVSSFSSIRRSLVWLALGAMLLAAGSGCWVPYVIDLGMGELAVLFNSSPITDVLAAGGLDLNAETKLRYVLDVRSYAVDVLGLNGGDSYLTYHDSGEGDVLYNVSACRKDRFEPHVWTFPIVGTLEYIGFFDECQAHSYGRWLEANGWDVYLYPPAGYSTLGWFPDPLFRAALDRDVIDLADLVIHEFTHNTAYKPGNSVFNESLATFVGRTGTLAYLADRFGQDNGVLAFALKRWQDTDLYNRFWYELYAALEALYGRQDLTSDQKIARREEVFDEFKQRFRDDYLPEFHDPERYAGLTALEFDNALVMIHRRYNLDLDLFQAVYDALGQDLPAAIRVFTASAGADDPKQYLRDWLATRQ